MVARLNGLICYAAPCSDYSAGSSWKLEGDGKDSPSAYSCLDGGDHSLIHLMFGPHLQER